MLWAIDVGNTQTVVGIRHNNSWSAIWRLSTQIGQTEDEFASILAPLLELSNLEFLAESVIIASVVPGINDSLIRFAKKWLKVSPVFVTNGEQIGLNVEYTPSGAVGADRIVNALAGKARYGAPLVIVDFGTATTFDAINSEGAYVGGAILPGIVVSMEALVSRTAKLPQIQLVKPDSAIGKSTVTSLQSGLVLGTIGAINALATQISSELGGARIVATGGLGEMFAELCDAIELYDEWLTLDGLLGAHQILSGQGD